MPINTTSTGATYGKSSDPLCPLGFHPQVRWPTRCKRCFRDYKEHSDDNDRARFSNLSRPAEDSGDHWATPGRRQGFQKSRSLDVSALSESKFRSDAASTTSSFASRTTTTTSFASGGGDAKPTTSSGTEDIPEWKRSMLERQAARQREIAEADDALSRFASPKTAAPTAAAAAAAAPPTTTTSFSRSSSWQRTSYSSTSEDRSGYSTSTSGYSSDATATTTKSVPSSAAATSRARRADSEDHSAVYRSFGDSSSSDPAAKVTFSEPEKPKTVSWERTPKPLAAAEPEPSKAAPAATPSWKSSYSSSKAAEPASTASSTATTTTPSWRKPSAQPQQPTIEEKPKSTPSWKKPAAAATTTSTTTTTTSTSVPAWKQQQSKTKLSSISESAAPKSSTAESSYGATSKTSSMSSSSSASSAAEVEKLKKESQKYKAEAETYKSYADKSTKLEAEVKGLKDEVSKLQRSNSTLKREKDDLEVKASRATTASMSSKPMSFESAKASETTAELMKAKEKISELEGANSRLETEKKGMKLKLKETESLLEKRPQSKDTNKTIMELETKLKYLENKSDQLEKENNYLQSNVQNLEGELEEVQDNFREDEVDEYRHLKRDLEATAKNCRVLQFKLKKAEKTISELSASGGGGAVGMDNGSAKIRQLEKDLDQKNQVNKQLEQQIADLKKSSGGQKRLSGGPVLSRTGSVERSYEDQLLKDLQDSIERENDLKEQLNMAEDESNEMRKKLSRMEDETESLGNQLKKMTRKGASSSRGIMMRGSSDEGISQDGEELTMAEIKVQLEVSEGETGLLRKKVENLLTDNLKLTKEIKEANKAKAKPGYSSSRSGGDPDARLHDVQDELNSTRVKLIEKEREIEKLDTQLKNASKGKATIKRSGSQDDDIAKKMSVVEKEAAVLREKNAALENENDRLANDNKQLLKDMGKKRPSSTQEKLSMDKFALEEKVKKLELGLKDKDKEIHKLTDNARLQQQNNVELDRLKREKNNLEYEMQRQKSNAESEKRRVEKMERDVAIASEKVDKAQREVVTSEREKRKVEEEKKGFEDRVAKLDADLRQVCRERDRLRDESESARQKNRDNLAQTQEGIKAFKDQIESLKHELADEKSRHRDSRRASDDKARALQTDVRAAKQTAEQAEATVADLDSKLKDVEDKWVKSKRINKQKQDKIDALEAQLDSSSAAKGGPDSPTALKKKIAELETKLKSAQSSSTLQKENADLKKQVEDLKSKKPLSAGSRSVSGDAASIKQELDDTIAKHELLEEEYVVAKAKLQMERDEMKSDYDAMKSDYDTIKNELATLRRTYSTKSDEWIREKLDFQQRMNDLGDSLRSSAGEGWESERDRFKNIIGDRDNQITQLKIEGDVTRSQVSQLKRETDDLKVKLADYEKMSKFQKAVATDDATISGLNDKLDDAKKKLAAEQRDRKSEVNTIKMKYDSKVALMGEEITSLKAQSAKYRRERETLKEMMDSKTRSGRTSAGAPGDEATELKHKVSDLTYQMQVLEDELAESKMTASKSNANSIALKSNYEIQVAELNSRINELEEEALIESGRARIAGTRTKMELAWQKERESQKKLITELNTMARDLKATLLEVEKERDRERLEAKRKIDGMKTAFGDEQDDTKKQITDLQYDLLELRDAHAKLRTTNEKLRRDKEKTERERDEFRYLVKERTRGEQGEEKKLARMLVDMEDMFGAMGKTLGEDLLSATASTSSSASTVDARAKANLKGYLTKLKEAKEDLEHIHKVNEEERERMSARRSVAKTTRGGSVEVDGDETPRGARGGSRGRELGGGSGRRLFRKAMSVGETIEEQALWKSAGSEAGSQESLASNASIPLPIPVRTRSAHGGDSDSGYNAMSIRRLERDTSVDRLSTGSRESNMSTQSEWLTGEKKKKSGLIGKLKKLTRKSEEKEFGSGSDISSFSVQSSATSAFQKVQEKAKDVRKRSSSKDRSASKDRSLRAKTPQEANEPFDKYFSGPFGPGASGQSTLKSSNGSQPAAAERSGRPSASASTSSSSGYMRRY